MIKLEIIGNIGQDAKSVNVNGKAYWRVSVAHQLKQDVTLWVNCMIPDRGKGIEHLMKGAMVCVQGYPTFEIYDGKINVTIWAESKCVLLLSQGERDAKTAATPSAAPAETVDKRAYGDELLKQIHAD
jgi:hypothetical protein